MAFETVGSTAADSSPASRRGAIASTGCSSRARSDCVKGRLGGYLAILIALSDRVRQYDIEPDARHGEGVHTFEYDAETRGKHPVEAGAASRKTHSSGKDRDGNGSHWKQVVDQESADALLDSTHGLHDAVVTSASWEGAEFVNASGALELRGLGALRLELESQFTDVRPLQLRFRGVRSLRYDYDLDVRAELSIGAAGVIARFLSWEIHVEALDWRERECEVAQPIRRPPMRS